MENKPTYEELQAQVEVLRSEIEFSATAILERSPSEEIHAIACSMIETAKVTPQHHLCELRAEAIHEAIEYATENYGEVRISELVEYADSIRQEGEVMEAHKTFFWYWGITALVVAAMFVAETPLIISTAFSYYGMYVGFSAAESIRFGNAS